MKYDNRTMKKKYIFSAFILTIFSAVVLSGCFMGPILDERHANDINSPKITKSLPLDGEPETGLFDKYFSSIKMNSKEDIRGSGDNKIIFFPLYNGGMISFMFKEKNEFTFMITVFDPVKKRYIERLSYRLSSEGHDGCNMEFMENPFLYPGDYEFRIFVEDKLIKVMPFKIISMWKYYYHRLKQLIFLNDS